LLEPTLHTRKLNQSGQEKHLYKKTTAHCPFG